MSSMQRHCRWVLTLSCCSFMITRLPAHRLDNGTNTVGTVIASLVLGKTRKERITPFGINVTNSLVIYWTTQVIGVTGPGRCGAWRDRRGCALPDCCVPGAPDTQAFTAGCRPQGQQYCCQHAVSRFLCFTLSCYIPKSRETMVLGGGFGPFVAKCFVVA